MTFMQNQYDIIIIGSGVGGGTVADELRQYVKKGLKVLILEGGAYRKKEHFNQNERDMSSIFFNKGAFFSKNMHIGLAAAKTVGGSSAVYTGVSFRPPASVVQKWKTEFGLDFLTDEFVENTFLDIEKKINVHELPDSFINDNNRLFKQAAEKLGITVKNLKINIKNCQQQGFCNLGCTVGAKQGTLEVQLPDAINDGVELIYNAWVESIGENTVKFDIREAPEMSEPNVEKEGSYEIGAKVIVLAGGVMQTPALVQRSEHKLKLKNKLVGRYVTLHPVFNLNAVYQKTITNYEGFPKAYYIDEFSDGEGYYLETSFYYPGITSKNIPGYGKIHSEIMKKYDQMMSILILSHDPSEYHNRILIDKKGQAVLDYAIHPEVKKSLIKAIRKAATIFFSAGCTEMIVPGSQKYLLTKMDSDRLYSLITNSKLIFEQTPLSSAHPQGGMRMHKDAASGVVDTNGKIWGTSSVYVADASVFPSSTKVNPYETIMLLATHISRQIMKTHFQSLIS